MIEPLLPLATPAVGSQADGNDSRMTEPVPLNGPVSADDEQQSIFRASTHFNPVDLVCGLRTAEGKRYPLDTFVDPDAVIVTRKSVGGSRITALERPGLWNGAMSGWKRNTTRCCLPSPSSS